MHFIASLPGSVQPEFHGLATNYHETLAVSRSCLNLSVIFKIVANQDVCTIFHQYF